MAPSATRPTDSFATLVPPLMAAIVPQSTPAGAARIAGHTGGGRTAPLAPAEFVAARSPLLSKHRPFGASRLGLPPTIAGLRVTAGTGAALLIRLALANSTRVFGASALLDQR